MSLHWLKSLCGMLLLAILSSGAAAQDCPARFAFSTADDRQGCIADYGYFEASPYGWPSVLRRLIPVSGAYVVAAAPNLPSCRPGFGFVGPRQTGMPLQSVPDDAERIDRAMRDCGQQAGHPEGLCACRLLLVDARSTFSLSEFEAYVGHRGSFALPPPPPPVTPMAPADAAAMVAVENAVAAGVAQFVERYQPGLSAKPEAKSPVATAVPGPSTLPVAPAVVPSAPPAASGVGDELASLREQLRVLQAQLSAQAERQGSTAPPALKARALVIGNSRYMHLGSLYNPRNDAEAIAEKFRSYGIDVDVLHDADRPGFVRGLNDFQEKAGIYDVNILFYAGHGLQVNGINYLVPVEMSHAGASIGMVKLSAVSLNDALEYLPARTRLVFLDACRDNPLSRSLTTVVRGTVAGLAPVDVVSGTLVAYATKDGSVASDGTGRHSPYTAALLQHLDAAEDIAVVLRRVRETVLKSTNNRQEPWEYGSLIGEKVVLSRMARMGR